MIKGISFTSENNSEKNNTDQKLIYNFCIVTSGFSVFYFFIAYTISFEQSQMLMAIDALLFFGLSLMFKTKVHTQIIAFLYLLICFISTHILVFYSGGLYSSITPWFIIIPLVAMLLQGVTSGVIWTMMGVLSIITIASLQFTDNVPERSYNPDFHLFFTATVIGGLLLIVVFLTYLFAKHKRQAFERLELSLQEIKSLNTLYNEQSKEVSSQNEELRQQQEEILSQREYIEDQNDILKATVEEMQRQNRSIEGQKKEFQLKNQFIEKFNKVLLNLAKSKNIQDGKQAESLEEITALSANILNAGRVSVWYYEPDPEILVCKKLYIKEDHYYQDGLEIPGAAYPNFFSIIKSQKVVNATKAAQDPATSEFIDNYLTPFNIRSVLVIPFVFNNVLGGVISFENLKVERAWSPEEIAFAVAIGDIVNLTYSLHKRKESERKIIEQGIAIQTKNEQLLIQKSEIQAMNSTLESRVEERTKALNEQNEKLAEYAFINSHLLRGPLSRIMGLLYLFNLDDAKSHQEIMEHMMDSAKELDLVVNQINKALDEGNHFSREDFGKIDMEQVNKKVL